MIVYLLQVPPVLSLLFTGIIAIPAVSVTDVLDDPKEH